MGSTDTYTLKVNNPGSPIDQWQRQMECELLLLIPSRTLRANGGYFLGEFTFDAGDGGFLKIRSSYCFFS